VTASTALPPCANIAAPARTANGSSPTTKATVLAPEAPPPTPKEPARSTEQAESINRLVAQARTRDRSIDVTFP
jgi:hypothetical protein